MTSDGARAASLCLLLATATQLLATVEPNAAERPSAASHRRHDIGTSMVGDSETIAFTHAPYPFSDGMVPADPQTAEKPFFQDESGRRFHLAPRGGKLFESETYSDNRSLLLVPPRFDPKAPNAMLVLFLHGNLATLETVRSRQHVPQQVAASGANAVLVAPALARNALDSSPGRFYEQDFFDQYLDEAADHLSAIALGRVSPAQIDRLPVVIVAYSGGYLATAFSLHYASGPRRHRIAGVILLDALFGERKKFEDWLVANQAAASGQRPFFVSAASAASADLNRDLEAALAGHGIASVGTMPDVIGPGTVAFVFAPAANHNDFMTMAWTKDPLAAVLRRISVEDGGAAMPQP